MKYYLPFISAFLVFITSEAQNFKIKKGEVLINKTKVASIQKVKQKGTNYYLLSDINNNPICRVQDLEQQSLLYPTDKSYPFRAFFGEKLSDTLTITKKNYWLSEKRIIDYALKIGMLNDTGFDESKTQELILSTPKLPEWITERIKGEQELVEQRQFKVERTFKQEDTFVKSYESRQATSQLNKSIVTQIKYDIYQGDPNGNNILIGHGIYETGTVRGTWLFILNTKNVPLASYSGAKLKLYEPFKEISPLKHEVTTLSGTSKSESIKQMAIELIKRDLL
ncbi:hypothetical protein LV716_03495 [Flagellimonas sp. HMM57]|uniref:hypothetical protein n=1 Tax=unclassified Flagellimonas TaxID=2644544 RepID=UPI0013CF440D|nr:MULTISPECIES: hypothetical protein [unclassified Flagellimonas]UII76865.1 hypothetical protein LV716_03495 [Flagellimonas sp. HMM57]